MSHLYWLHEAHLKRIKHLFPKSLGVARVYVSPDRREEGWYNYLGKLINSDPQKRAKNKMNLWSPTVHFPFLYKTWPFLPSA